MNMQILKTQDCCFESFLESSSGRSERNKDANCHRKEMRRCREGENEAGATVHPPVSLRGGARGSLSGPWRCHFTATSAQGNANS